MTQANGFLAIRTKRGSFGPVGLKRSSTKTERFAEDIRNHSHHTPPKSSDTKNIWHCAGGNAEMIVLKQLHPSRDDAVRLTRNGKMAMILLAHTASVLEDLNADIGDRLDMIEDGHERLHMLAEESDRLLNDVRLTIPIEQRKNLENTCRDYEMRTMPKSTPSVTNVLMHKDEFKELVDYARTKCRDCTEDDEECEKCGLFRLLSSVLPLDDYHHQYLCPYNLGKWGN